MLGPKRLPELGKTLGRTLKGFQSASSEFEKEFKSAITTADITTADITTTEITTSEITTANLPEVRPGEIQAVGQVVKSEVVGLPQVVDGPPA